MMLLGLFFLHDLNILVKSTCEMTGVLGDPPTDLAREGGEVSLERIGVVGRERGDRFRGGVVICLGEVD
jgi:hypothetical protein